MPASPSPRERGETLRPSREAHPVATFRERMNQLLDELWQKVGTQHPAVSGRAYGGPVPAETDMSDRVGALHIEIEVPGVEEKDLEVAVAGNEIVVSGQKRSECEERGGDFILRERACGRFSRAYRLPSGLDPERTKANYSNGVLTIAVPRKPGAKPAARRIPVKAR